MNVKFEVKIQLYGIIVNIILNYYTFIQLKMLAEPTEEAARIEQLVDFYNYDLHPDSRREFHDEVLEGNIDMLKQLVESGESVNSKDSSTECSLLHLAVIRKNFEILEYLLSREDIDVNANCSEGTTPLYLAAGLGYFEFANKLIKAGADLNAADCDGSPPLNAAVCHPDVCQLLLRHGAQMYTDDCRASTLQVAIENKCLEIVYMLLYYNVDVNYVDKYGCTAFMTALMRSYDDAQEALLDYVTDFNVSSHDDLYGGSTLYHALEGNSPFVKDIVERGADVNYGDDPGVRDEQSAFSVCVSNSVNLATFKIVWEKLRYNDVKNTIDLLDLLSKPDIVPTFLQVIIESDNFEPAVKLFSKGENYILFVNKFAEKEFDHDQLTALTCRLLQYGFRTTSYDVHAIFSHYGDCELFRILLYMDNDFSRGWLPKMVLSRLICDVHFDLEGVVDKVSDIPKEAVLQLLQYSVYPRLIDVLTLQYRDEESTRAIFSSLPKVPLLIELARNAARKQIWQAFKITNNCQFYTTIDYMDIPTVYKTILTFKRKIYSVN